MPSAFVLSVTDPGFGAGAGAGGVGGVGVGAGAGAGVGAGAGLGVAYFLQADKASAHNEATTILFKSVFSIIYFFVPR